jgi:dTMP kinase
VTDPVSVPEEQPEGRDWARIRKIAATAAASKAPFIPRSPEGEPMPLPSRGVFSNKGFPRLFAAQVVSSIGDWTGIVAIIALAGNVSTNAVGFVLVARMLPGFILAPLGGALVDRWNRKVVMVTADLGRAALLIALPFWDNLAGLIVISFSLEVLTLLWGPAKDATVPNIVKDPDQLASANSLGLFAAFGMMPVGSVLFAVLAAVSSWVSNFSALHALHPAQASLAIWVDAGTFLASAALISGLVLKSDNHRREHDVRALTVQIWRDVVDGLKFIRSSPTVRGVMVGLAGGLLGGGCIVPLGAVFAKEVLGATDSSAFGFLMTAFGIGAAIGVAILLAVQRHLPRPEVFTGAVVGTGLGIIVLAWLSTLALTILVVAAVGAAAGSAYVTGFTLLQESVSDEMRGRMFGALYTVVRLSLLLSLTISPFVAGAFGTLSKRLVDGQLPIGSAHLALPGVRLALLLGGAITVVAGLAARRRMRKTPPVVEVAGS